MKLRPAIGISLLLMLIIGCNTESSLTGPGAGKETSLPPLPDTSASLQAREVRGTWLSPYAFRDENARTNLIREITEMRLNTVFVVAPSIGRNYGWADETAFRAFVKMAHAARLTVYAWIGNMHRTEGTEADFTDPGEQDAQAGWAVDLLQEYGGWVDGIHLDFIRYSTWQDVNNGHKMDGVTATIRKIHDAVSSRFRGKSVTSTCFTTAPGMVDFQKEDVPAWYRSWFAAHPGNYYATAYADFPTVPEHMKFQQDPVGWATEGIVDAFIPMQYTVDDYRWVQEAQLFKSFLQSAGAGVEKFWMGLGWLAESGKSDWGYDAAGIVRKIKQGRALGVKGFVIFELGRFGCDRDQELADALTKNSAVNEGDAPFRSQDDVTGLPKTQD